VRLNHFGRIDDLALGALLGQLRAESTMDDLAKDLGNAALQPPTV
jgi:hypothetical protein